MLVDPEPLAEHLDKLIPSLIPEVVFRGTFAVKAATVDRDFAVLAPGIAEIDPLVEPVGLPKLGQLVGALRIMEDWKVRVALDFDAQGRRLRLLTDGVPRVHRIAFSCCEPKVIGTRLEEAFWREIGGRPEEMDWVPLPKTVARGVEAFIRLLGESWISVSVGPDGSMFRIGPESRHHAYFDLPELRSEEPVEVLLPDDQLAPVLAAVTDWGAARVGVSRGPPPCLWVREDEFRWVMVGAEEVD